MSRTSLKIANHMPRACGKHPTLPVCPMRIMHKCIQSNLFNLRKAENL